MPDSEKTKQLIEDIKRGSVRFWPVLCLQPLRMSAWTAAFFLLGVAVGRFFLR
jgi:hypothetical protein